MRFNWTTPFVFEQNLTQSCSWSFLHPFCREATLTRRETLAKPSNGLVEFHVEYDGVPQQRFLNLNDKSVPLHAEQSTWNTTGTDAGWNVGAALSQKDLTISSGYHSNKHQSIMTISSLGISEECPPYHHCRFENWFYYVKLVGKCARQAIIGDCGQEKNACGEGVLRTANWEDWINNLAMDLGAPFDLERGARLKDQLLCSDARTWVHNTCWDPSGLRYVAIPESDCSLRAPIMDTPEKQLSTLVFVKEKELKEEAIQDSVPRATRAVEHCLFLLDNGLWYDSSRNKYNTAGGNDTTWVHRPNDPKPIIPKNIRLEDCPLSKDLLHREESSVGITSHLVGKAKISGVAGRQKRWESQDRDIDVKVVGGFSGFLN